MQLRTTLLIIAASLSFSCDVLAASNTVRIAAVENAWVSAGGGDNNEAEHISVKRNNLYGSGGNGAGAQIVYFRFELEELSRIKEVITASLDLYLRSHINGTGQTIRVTALNDGYTNATRSAEWSWTAAMTRDTAPGGQGAMPTADTSGLLGELYTIQPSNIMSIALSPGMMNSQVTNDSNGELTLIIYGSGEGTITSFSSISNTSGYPVPTLTITGDFKPPLGTVIQLY